MIIVGGRGGGSTLAARLGQQKLRVLLVERVKNEVYSKLSKRALKTYLRWLIEDPEYKRRAGLILVRSLDPRGWLPAPVVYRAMLRGAFGDLRRFLDQRLGLKAIRKSWTCEW